MKLVDNSLIEINGVRYALKESQTKSYSKRTAALVAMATVFSSAPGFNSYSRKMPNVNLTEEFEKIQNKTSDLCRYDREQVIQRFNELYIKTL